jgi:tetratricopeptide (TPR) repeat protein
MSNREDDFSPATIKQLAARVNYKCSNPDCRATTTGPHTDPTKSVNIGNAAHITAASLNGARYDKSLTSEQRKHIDNGIWLCATHATEVDRDEIRFTVELLKKWKQDAESEARNAIGKPQIQTKFLDMASVISSQQITISSQQEIIHKLTVDKSVDLEHQVASDVKWKSDIERALKWSESGEASKVQVVQEIVTEIRRNADFSQVSLSLQSRLATAAAIAAVNVGDKETADNEVKEAFRLAPENTGCLSNMAAVAIMRNEYERAAILAEQVRAKDPQNENAALVLIQAWHHTNKPDLVETFLKENSWLLELPNGCAVIAQIRSNANHFDEAIRFAELALKKDKNHIQALEVLYDATFSPLRDRVLSSEDWDYSLRTRRKLQRAEAAVNRAIRILEKLPDKERLHRALSNRAAVFSAQEKTEQAFSDVDRILNDNPSEENRDTANLNKAMILIHVGRGAEALPFLQALTTERWKEEGMFALAYSFHVKGQASKAIEIWESLWKPEICDAQQMMTASLLLWVYRRANNDAGADSVLERVKHFHPDHYEVQYLEAQDKYDSGDVEGAIGILRAAAESCRANNDHAGRIKNLMSMGDILYRTGKVKQATAIWKEIGWEKLLPPHRNAFLNALYRSGEISEALKVAQSIRQQLGFVPRAAELEAAIYSYMGDHQVACEIWEELARREPGNYLHNINRANAALMAENKEEAQQALEEVSFESIRNDADSLRRVSALLNAIGHKEAIHYAFRARQIEFGNPDSHHNYVQVFLGSTNLHSRDENGIEDNSRAADVLSLNGPDWGTVPCTIRLVAIGETDERKYRAFTILNEGPFDIPRGIYPPNHDLAKQLLAIRDSEQVIPIQDSSTAEKQEYHVSEVLSPYVHAFQESLLRTQEWFGPDARIWSIDVRDGFDEFWKFIDATGKGFQEAINQYKEWHLPLNAIAANGTHSQFDLWFLVSRQSHLGIHAEHGNFKLFEQSLKSLEEKGDKPTLALDSTVLIAITHLELPVSKSNFRLLISQSLHKSLKNLSAQSLTVDFPAELPSKILQFIEDNVEVLPANAVIQFLPEDISLWQRVFGHEDLDSALIAFEHDALLYSDDAILRDAAKFYPAVESTSTRVILEYLFRRNDIEKEAYFSSLENSHSLTTGI